MDQFIYQILDFLSSLGYLGIALGLMIEIIPSEIVLAYGGYLITLGKVSLLGTIIAGTIGGVLAQLFLYWMGYYGGRPFLDRYGRYLLIKKKHLDLSEKWFDQYGTGIIFSARFIPVVRHAVSIPAGIARMSIWRFLLYTTLAIIPWSILFVVLGSKIGENWAEIKQISTDYLDTFLLFAIGIGLLYFIYHFYTIKKKKK